MNKWVMIPALCVASFAGIAASAADLAGHWALSADFGGKPFVSNCEFVPAESLTGSKVEGSKLVAMCTLGVSGYADPTDLVVDGQKVKWDWDTGSGIMKMEAVIDSGTRSMNGEMNIQLTPQNGLLGKHTTHGTFVLTKKEGSS